MQRGGVGVQRARTSSRGRRGRGRTCGRCSRVARRRAIARAWAPPPPGTPRRSSDPTSTPPPPPPHRRSPAAPAPPSPGLLLPPPQPLLLMYCRQPTRTAKPKHQEVKNSTRRQNRSLATHSHSDMQEVRQELGECAEGVACCSSRFLGSGARNEAR
jgi:hypothetical protein